MKLRVVGAAVVALLAAAVLTGCRTNVGVAARIDGHKVSESDVANYLTSRSGAAPALLNPQTPLPARTFVLDVLVADRFTAAIVARIPGAPTASDVAKELERERGSKSYESFATGLGAKLSAKIPAGYTQSLYKIAARAELNTEVLGSASQSGTDLKSLVTKVKFPLWINPRYGTWSRSTLSMNGTSGHPSFVTVPAAGAGG